jgi:hypothetical protein
VLDDVDEDALDDNDGEVLFDVLDEVDVGEHGQGTVTKKACFI